MKSLPSQLPIFVQVARTLSFAQAARDLGISAPAVSKAIGKLEQEWQTKLFLRSSHSLSLTPIGEQLFRRLAPSMAHIQESIESLTEEREGLSGVIKINLPASSIGQDIILPMIIAFMQQYPDVQCDITFEDRSIDLIEHGFDLGIGTSINEDSRLIARPVMLTEIGVFASKQYIEANGEPKTIQDLENHRLIPVKSVTTGRTHRWRLNDGQDNILYDAQGHLMVNSFSAAKVSTVLGAGISCLGSWMFESELEKGTVLPLLKDNWGESINVWLYYASREYQPTRVKLLVDFLVAKLSK